MDRIRSTAVIAAACLCAPAAVTAQAPSEAASPIVEIVAEDYTLDAPSEIPSGWTTIRFRNQGAEHHMLYLARLPEGVSFEQYQREAQVPFDRVWQGLRGGTIASEQALDALVQALPSWYGGVGLVGGPGLIAAGLVSDVTLRLEPGEYALECYVKNADGAVHYMEGMTRPLRVTAEPSSTTAPEADVRITLANDGLSLEGTPAAGRNTIAVHVRENPEIGFGHSVHIARLEPGVAIDQVTAWLNWLTVDGLREDAPVDFVGGMHPMPAGQTAYFTVDLEPGRYLAVSEATGAQGVQQEFTVH